MNYSPYSYCIIIHNVNINSYRLQTCETSLAMDINPALGAYQPYPFMVSMLPLFINDRGRSVFI